MHKGLKLRIRSRPQSKKRKEVTKVKYSKPKLSSYSALASVQSNQIPKQLPDNEQGVDMPSEPAYQADE